MTALASQVMQTPIALVSLVGRDKQEFRSRIGTDLEGSPAEISFCAHTIAEEGDAPFLVENATLDARFAKNELVTGPLHIRFYAGSPLIVGGEKVGSLCVLDTVPRERPDDARLAQLKSMATLVSSLLQLKDSARKGDIARTALVQEKKRHTLALEAASIASWVWDLRSNRIDCDELLPQMLGLPVANRIRASDLLRAIDRRDRRHSVLQLRQALQTGRDYMGEYRVGNTQPTRWLGARGRVLDHDAQGRPTLVFGVNFDITATKTSEERQRLLLREINHRVKNTLATVQALATQTLRHTREPRDFLSAFNGRLQALGLAHGLLSDMEWGGIDLAEVISLQAMPFTDKADPRIYSIGPSISLSPDQALGLGLILHELGSNALKHGALSTQTGHVDVSWQLEGTRDHPRVTLHWEECGGPVVTEPRRSGFGSILIKRSLDKVLGSKVDHRFLPEGVQAEISLPLE
ncbi:histidine kinase [Tianweitania sp. BSSL-BM11]|uniref:histidine kinase n=2 Tax=Tianweitania aestuarii TaxID=2814886 RepID=A0ABS5RZP1_9HYPH|nr:histidine kinase [Tianweitania aestuarii]